MAGAGLTILDALFENLTILGNFYVALGADEEESAIVAEVAVRFDHLIIRLGGEYWRILSSGMRSK